MHSWGSVRDHLDVGVARVYGKVNQMAPKAHKIEDESKRRRAKRGWNKEGR